MSVAINYVGNRTAAEETAASCDRVRQSTAQRFPLLQADIGVPEDRERLLNGSFEALGVIDALINNAGIGPRARADVTQTAPGSFEEVLRTNLEGPFFLTQAVVNHWLEKKPAPALPGGFTVVFNTSISADTASLNRAEYCISKAGLAMAAQVWALRLAGAGIIVYELRPGIMATDMTAGVREKYDRMLAEGAVPQNRWGTAEDVGLAVGALLAGGFPYSTGSVIYVDGGFHLRRL
jgi:NAD(P)-dependent dehydrogenase (short-subunit alcohol dehydrogenase family)